MAEPRTRDNRIPREKITVSCVEKGRKTCPRCGWRCRHLVVPYYDSEWIEHGGICGQCCAAAAAHFDRTEWPPYREDHPFYRADPPEQGSLSL